MFEFISNFQNKKGLTLLELVVAMMLISIISVAVLSMFLNSHVGIIRAGKDSVADYNVQDTMEQVISDSLNGPTMSTDFNMQLSFPTAGLINIDATGRKIDVDYNYSGISKTLSAFTINP